VDKSGGFIGALYFNKTENVAISLVKGGLATVHSFSVEGVPWSRQLYDAQVRLQLFLYIVINNIMPTE
jgi:staphylococcal nuclease domain-containing protein 1